MDMKVSRMVTVIVTSILRSRLSILGTCPLGKGVGNLPMVIVFVVSCGFESAGVQSNAFVVVLITVIVVTTVIDIVQLVFIGKTDTYIPGKENWI